MYKQRKVLAMLSKLGHKTAFIGKVGNDFLGEQLRKAISEAGIDSSYLLTDKTVHTTLAMVHTYPDGDRDFSLETIGAGDTFFGCVLHSVCEHGLEDLTQENLMDMLTFANAAASIITTRKGALRVMPERKEVEALIGKYPEKIRKQAKG